MNEQQQPSDESGDITIHNAEQIEVMNSLEALRVSFGIAASEVAVDATENESLHKQAKFVNWTDFTCVRAERWIDNEGKLGWRCYANVSPDPLVEALKLGPPTRILAAVASKLQNMGWDACEVVPA